MKTGNGQRESANKKIWKGSPKTVSNNIVKAKAPVKFSAKSDSFKSGRKG